MTGTKPPFVGHKDALGEAQEAFRSGRMPHAWLISGSEGIGKAAFAKHLAQFALADGQGDIGTPDPENPTVRLVDAETHPDLMIVRRETDEKTGALKGTIPVDAVQKIAPFLHKTASHGGWRVVILDEAHTLNRHGQNAILKIVEEPPPRALILLTVTTPGVLLPTIRSRSRVLQLSPLGDEDLRTLLQASAPQTPPDEAEAVIKLSNGSIGFALKIIRTQSLPLYREMLDILNGLPELDVARQHKLTDRLARKADAEAFDVLTTLLIEHLRLTAREEARKYPQGRVDKALDLWKKTRETLATAERSNLDPKLAFINAICDLRAGI